MRWTHEYSEGALLIKELLAEMNEYPKLKFDPTLPLLFTVDSQVFFDRLKVTAKCLVFVPLFKIRQVMKL
jgi:hypothetical protein